MVSDAHPIVTDKLGGRARVWDYQVVLFKLALGYMCCAFIMCICEQ